MRYNLLIVAATVLFTGAAHGQGTFILWDESVNGELSDSGDRPTSLTPLRPGVNTLLGATEVERVGNNWLGHDEFFTIQIPTNLYISAITIQVDKPSVWTWIGD